MAELKTTRERAIELTKAAIANPPTREARELAATDLLSDTSDTILWVPSINAMRLLIEEITNAKPRKGVTPGKDSKGNHCPAGPAEALTLLGLLPNATTSDEPWPSVAYPPKMECSGYDIIGVFATYYRAFHDIAIDAGYKEDATKPTPADVLKYRSLGAVALARHEKYRVAILALDPVDVEILTDFRVTRAKFADGRVVVTRGGTIVYGRPYLHPEKLTVEELDAIQDEDLKAHAIGGFAGPGTGQSAGWMKYLEAVGAEVLDERANDIEGTHEALFKAKEHAVFVATCPTARLVALTCPPTVKTCVEAYNWLHRDRRVVART